MNQSGRDTVHPGQHRIGKRQSLPEKSAGGNEEISPEATFEHPDRDEGKLPDEKCIL